MNHSVASSIAIGMAFFPGGAFIVRMFSFISFRPGRHRSQRGLSRWPDHRSRFDEEQRFHQSGANLSRQMKLFYAGNSWFNQSWVIAPPLLRPETVSALFTTQCLVQAVILRMGGGGLTMVRGQRVLCA